MSLRDVKGCGYDNSFNNFIAMCFVEPVMHHHFCPIIIEIIIQCMNCEIK